MGVVVDAADFGLLPFEQLEPFADIFAFGDEADLLDEGDDVGARDLVVDRIYACASARALISQGRDFGVCSNCGPAARATMRERGVARSCPNR